MNVDKDIETFFEIVSLDWKNFSFEKLINGYIEALYLIADKDEEKYYMNIELLSFFVNTFSKILEQFFESNMYEKVAVDMFCTERVLEVKGKTSGEYTENDKVVGLSFMIAHKFIENYKIDFEFEDVMTIFNTMFKNFYHIEQICESVENEFQNIQKGIGVMTS